MSGATEREWENGLYRGAFRWKTGEETEISTGQALRRTERNVRVNGKQAPVT